MSDSFDNMRKMMREFKKNNQHDLSNEGTNIDRNFQEKLENTENTQEIEVQNHVTNTEPTDNIKTVQNTEIKIQESIDNTETYEDVNDIENVSDENQELKETNVQSINYKTDNHEDSSNEEKKTNKCLNCGEENDIENEYCLNCGEYLPVIINSENREDSDDSKKEKKQNDEMDIKFENIDESGVIDNKVEEITTDPEVDYVICPNCNNSCSEDFDFCNKCGTKLKVDYKCPNCGIEFTDEDAFCKKCGTKLPQVPIKIYKQIDNKLYCPTCGAKYEKGDVFCGECGKSLSSNINQVRQNSVQEENEKDSYSKQKNTIDKVPNQSYNEYNTVKCPYCGSKIQRYTQKCPNCGEWISGVSHFGCGSFLMILTTIIAICMAIGGENIGIPLVGEIGGIWLVIVAFLYFLPSLISDWRGHDSKFAIFIVNLLFGWTFIGWFAALIFSFTGRSR